MKPSVKNSPWALVLIVAVNLTGLVALATVSWLAVNEAAAVGQLEQTALAVKNRQDNLAALEQALRETAAERAIIRQYFFRPATLPSLVEKLETLAAAHQTEISFSNLTIGGNSGVNLVFQLSGTYRDIIRALAALERQPDRSRFRAVELKAAEGAWQARVELVVYNFINDEE